MTTARRDRTDVHRPSAIEPGDYEYRWIIDTAGVRGLTAARYEAALTSSSTSVYRDTSRCDHCGTHLRYAVIYEHVPTGEYVCTGITCAEKTMSVPNRMMLRVRRLRALTTMRRERRQRKEEAEKLYPRATAILGDYAFSGGSNPFVLSVSRKYVRGGWLSGRQAVAVVNAVERSIPRGRGADAADLRRRERGAELHRDGQVRYAGEGVYMVAGSDGGEYPVTLDPENCPCPDHEKGNRCKHVYAALAAEKAMAVRT